MIRKQISGVSVAADLTGFASNVTGATWALTATVSGDDLAHKVTVRNDSATDHRAKTITLTGTSPEGAVQTEALGGPNSNATVTSTKYWLTLTAITVSATIGADTFDIGWAADSVSATLKPELSAKRLHGVFNIGVGCSVDSGTPTYSLQYTLDGVTWFTHATITGKSAAFDGSITSPVAGVRVLWTVAGGVTATILQMGDA